jgi:predicted nucleic acid-binding protein
LVTTNHVVAESYTLLRVRLGATEAHEFLRRVRSSGGIRRVFIQEPWEEAAEILLAQYRDQDFSYVDATSFVAMRRLGLQEVLAFDHHFAIVGFTLTASQ